MTTSVSPVWTGNWDRGSTLRETLHFREIKKSPRRYSISAEWLGDTILTFMEVQNVFHF